MRTMTRQERIETLLDHYADLHYRRGDRMNAYLFADLRYNLRCSRGHRFWAPRPHAWAGKECGASRDGSAPCRFPIVILVEKTAEAKEKAA